ncbi:MAG: response regulator transcription factor [Clostridia bacterium]|nr:response regulator transcription factor [Clostridia bacterium]
MYKVLFADDDSKIRATVSEYFTANGFDITTAKNGEEAVDAVSLHDYDIIILDVMMPVLDGIGACREIRKTCKTPVLFLTALGQEQDYLNGFSAGADDYIVKPFPLAVLQEKCLAVIRRYTGANSGDTISIGGVTIDCFKKKVTAGGREISLTSKDFEILQYLMSKKGVILNRSLILSRVWGYDFDGDDRVVDTHIKNIRKALGEQAYHIKTVSGMGYCFEEE